MRIWGTTPSETATEIQPTMSECRILYSPQCRKWIVKVFFKWLVISLDDSQRHDGGNVTCLSSRSRSSAGVPRMRASSCKLLRLDSSSCSWSYRRTENKPAMGISCSLSYWLLWNGTKLWALVQNQHWQTAHVRQGTQQQRSDSFSQGGGGGWGVGGGGQTHIHTHTAGQTDRDKNKKEVKNSPASCLTCDCDSS